MRCNVLTAVAWQSAVYLQQKQRSETESVYGTLLIFHWKILPYEPPPHPHAHTKKSVATRLGTTHFFWHILKSYNNDLVKFVMFESHSGSGIIAKTVA